MQCWDGEIAQMEAVNVLQKHQNLGRVCLSKLVRIDMGCPQSLGNGKLGGKEAKQGERRNGTGRHCNGDGHG